MWSGQEVVHMVNTLAFIQGIKRMAKMRKKSGFTLIELLVAMGIVSLLGIVIVQSYVVSDQLSKLTGINASFVKGVSSFQSYMRYLSTNAGASLIPEDAIRTYSNISCSSPPDAFIQALCGANSSARPVDGTDVVVFVYGLPFTGPTKSDYARFAAQVVSTTGNTFTLANNSPLLPVVNAGAPYVNYYYGHAFMVYDMNNPGNSMIGYIRQNGLVKVGNQVRVTYANSSYPFNTASIASMVGGNAKMVMVDVETVYLDENGNVIVAFYVYNSGNGNESLVQRAIANNVEAMNIKYYDSVNNTWVDGIGAGVTARNLTRIKIGLAFTGYFASGKKCTGKYYDNYQVNLLGENFNVHVFHKNGERRYRYNDPCSILKIVTLEFPLKSIISMTAALARR